MISINKIKPNQFELRFDNFIVDLTDKEIAELRHLCYIAINDHVICRCCGVGNLKWQQVEGKWLLFDSGRLHDCPVKPLPELDSDKCDWL